jgi:hypothetical protein
LEKNDIAVNKRLTIFLNYIKIKYKMESINQLKNGAATKAV